MTDLLYVLSEYVGVYVHVCGCVCVCVSHYQLLLITVRLLQSAVQKAEKILKESYIRHAEGLIPLQLLISHDCSYTTYI